MAYGQLAVKTGKIGEAVMAHRVTNALLAAYALSLNQWQFF